MTDTNEAAIRVHDPIDEAIREIEKVRDSVRLLRDEAKDDYGRGFMNAWGNGLHNAVRILAALRVPAEPLQEPPVFLGAYSTERIKKLLWQVINSPEKEGGGNYAALLEALKEEFQIGVHTKEPPTADVGLTAEEVRIAEILSQARKNVAPLVAQELAGEHYQPLDIRFKSDGKGMDQVETFEWMRKRIYDELEPENAGLREERDELQAKLAELEQSHEIVACDGAVKDAIEERDAYRNRFGCLSCGEDHPRDSMCPPHEVRTTGRAWFGNRIVSAFAEIDSLKARLAAAEADNAAVVLAVKRCLNPLSDIFEARNELKRIANEEHPGASLLADLAHLKEEDELISRNYIAVREENMRLITENERLAADNAEMLYSLKRAAEGKPGWHQRATDIIAAEHPGEAVSKELAETRDRVAALRADRARLTARVGELERQLRDSDRQLDLATREMIEAKQLNERTAP